MISIIQNKTSLSYLFSGILLIFIIILVIPRISLVDNSEKINTKLMLNDYSRINKIPYNDLLTNDTIVISSKIRSYDIYWRTTDIYEWVGLNKINDSSVLFSSKMKSNYFQVKLEKEGKESFQYFTSANNLINVNISLDDKTDQDGVYFPAMELYLPNTNYSESHENLHIKPFYMDRYEVSNFEYKEFVDANGYYNEEYWPSELMHKGIKISFNEVKTSFVDKSNFPSPKDWQQGAYENGKDHFPVAGISWYEAYAYAKFREKSLPSVAEWYYAFDRNRPNKALENANINSYNFTKSRVETSSVNHNGIYDMVGNVREWVYNNITDKNKKGILGGSFADDPYLALDFYSQNAWDRNIYNGIRLVKKIEEDTSGEIFYVREKQRNFYENFQTSDKEWGIIKSMYLYDNDYIQIKNIGTTDVKDRDYFCENSEIIYGKTILPIHHLKANSDIKSKKAVIYFPGSHALFRDNLVYPSFFD
jgi:hypothetical protein